MSAKRAIIFAETTALVAALWLPALHLLGSSSSSRAGKMKVQAKSPAAKKTRSRPSHHRASQKTRKTSSTRRRHLSSRQRLAQLRLEPSRVEEIQSALGKQGYLKQEPTGRWDDQTRDAMRRFQSDHGFPVTGLPEAKSLMKLGLGPHPLPEELDPGSSARASADASARATPNGDQPPPQTSPASDIPPQP